MAKLKQNSLLQGLSGSVGDLVFRQMPDGSTQVSAKPVKDTRTFNEEQEGCQQRFQMAQAYAVVAKADPFYLALARELGRNAYHVALSDGLKSPVIHAIERSNGRVCVTASDNVLVARVLVSILDADGASLEQGFAAQPDPLHDPERWEYAARAEGTVEVNAWDLAHNRTTAVSSLSLQARAGEAISP